MVFFKWYSLSKWYSHGAPWVEHSTTSTRVLGLHAQPRDLGMSKLESAKLKGAGGSTKGAKHSSLAVAEWRTLLAEFFAPPWFGQQAESFVFAKNRDRKAENAKRKKEDELTGTLIVLQTFKNKASKEKKAAAKEEREPGQFQTPVAPAAKRIKTTEWAAVEDKVIELFDLTARHLPTRKVGLSWRYVLERARRWAGELYRVTPRHRAISSGGNEPHFRPAGEVKNIVY